MEYTIKIYSIIISCERKNRYIQHGDPDLIVVTLAAHHRQTSKGERFYLVIMPEIIR